MIVRRDREKTCNNSREMGHEGQRQEERMEDGNKGDTEIKRDSQGQIQEFFTKFFWKAENAVSAPY